MNVEPRALRTVTPASTAGFQRRRVPRLANHTQNMIDPGSQHFDAHTPIGTVVQRLLSGKNRTGSRPARRFSLTMDSSRPPHHHDHRLLLEVCVDTPEGVNTAAAHGADRIELCSALSVGGLTPSPGLMECAAAKISVGANATPVVAMVRPRAGDFVYTHEELVAMKADIRAARRAGLAGVVLGASRPDGSLDEEALAGLVAEARGMEGGSEQRPFNVTLHRAIDLTPDPVAAVEVAVRLGIDRILTSGGAGTAMEGRAVIRRMVEKAASRLHVMAGSGVNASNAAELIATTGVRGVHASCSSARAPFTEEAPVVAKARALGFMDAGARGGRFTDGVKVEELATVLRELSHT